MNDKVIYTCVTGNYDLLDDHTFINPDWDYVCFTDNPYILERKFKSWKVKKLKFDKLDPTRNNRWHKLHPHLLFPEYEMSLWVDSNVDILSPQVFADVDSAIDSGEAMSIAPHPERDCIYDEILACIEHGKDSPENMWPQIEKFKKDGFPSHYGLFETNVLLRKHNLRKVQKVMDDWWWWIENYSKRDQLSLTYVLWKHKMKVAPLTDKTYRNGDGRIKFWPHINEYRRTIMRLEAGNDEKNQIIENIKNARFFKLWQAISQFKRKLGL